MSSARHTAVFPFPTPALIVAVAVTNVLQTGAGMHINPATLGLQSGEHLRLPGLMALPSSHSQRHR